MIMTMTTIMNTATTDTVTAIPITTAIPTAMTTNTAMRETAMGMTTAEPTGGTIMSIRTMGPIPMMTTPTIDIVR